jgi:hypothetical protein
MIDNPSASRAYISSESFINSQIELLVTQHIFFFLRFVLTI